MKMPAQPRTARAAVHSIDHFALNVPSIADAERFFSLFGLDVTQIEAGLELRAADGHRWGRVLPAERKSLAYLSFNCHDGALDAIARQARDAGASPRVGNDSVEGLWFEDLDGNLLQVRVGPKTSPHEAATLHPSKRPPSGRGASVRSLVEKVHPRRMSHVLLFSPDVLRAVDFYEKALGLRLSDKSGDIIAFTHAPHGSDHHLVAFAKSSAKGWHHVSWDVGSIDEVGNGASQMAAAGYKDGWGTGRHVLGSNYFHYVRDPWGSFSEYSADIDFVPHGVEWESGDWPPEDSLYQWGPDVPDFFIHNTEA